VLELGLSEGSQHRVVKVKGFAGRDGPAPLPWCVRLGCRPHWAAQTV